MPPCIPVMSTHTSSIIEPIGDVLHNGHTLWANCRACGCHAEVALEALCERLRCGRSYLNGVLPLVCSRCGSQDGTITVAQR